MNDYLLLSELCREPLLTTEEAAVETRVPGSRITTHGVRVDCQSGAILPPNPIIKPKSISEGNSAVVSC